MIKMLTLRFFKKLGFLRLIKLHVYNKKKRKIKKQKYDLSSNETDLEGEKNDETVL